MRVRKRRGLPLADRSACIQLCSARISAHDGDWLCMFEPQIADIVRHAVLAGAGGD